MTVLASASLVPSADPTTSPNLRSDRIYRLSSSGVQVEEHPDNIRRNGSTNPLPALLCETCWEGPFSSYPGIFGERKCRVETNPKNGNSLNSGGYAYSSSRAQLGSRARAGCRWCGLVFAALEDNRDGDDDWRFIDPLEIRVGIEASLDRVGTPRGSQDMSVYINDELCFMGVLYTAEDDPAASYIVARSRILDVGSPRTLASAMASMEECVQGHKDCIPPPTSPPPFLPTRLIDCRDPEYPRLITTSGARGRYIALSYVWGEPQPHSTTTSNISIYECRIDRSQLPATIRDAIRVTHVLGVRYLWIDSLCIIQDSDEDKQREIGRMRHVYRDAYCTIVAASASRVGEGFLQDRPPVPHTADDVFSHDVALPFICPPTTSSTTGANSGRLGNVYVSPLWTKPLRPPRPMVRTQYNPACEPISSRGWTMQEYLMSPRSLVFASHTLQFRCQTWTVNIGGAWHCDTADETRLPDVLFLERPPLLERGSEQWAEVRNAWLKVITDYTQRSITVPSDKLLACGGIAEEFHRTLRSDYLAGLWRDSLLADLLWSKREGVHMPRPAEHRAPSWSWAAVDGAVLVGTSWDIPQDDLVAEVVRCEVILEDSSLPFGRVLGGSLVLRTPLIPCKWNIGEPNYLYSSCPLPLDHEPEPSTALLKESDADAQAERIGIGYLDSEDDAGVQAVWAAPVRGGPYVGVGIIVAVTVSPAGRVPAVGNGVRTYRRIGYYTAAHGGDGSMARVGELPLVEIKIV